MALQPATLQDRREIVALALKETQRYPALKPDHDKVFKLVTDAISSAKHFCWVSIDDNSAVRGVLIGLTGENLWAQRQFCSIPLWLSQIPGDGAKLLRTFRDWVTSRPALRVAGFALDTDIDPRAGQLAERIGFKRHGGAFLLYTRGYVHGIV